MRETHLTGERALIFLVLGLVVVALLNPFFGYNRVAPVAAGPAGGMIIDHTCTNIETVPEAAITQAKSQLHIAYGHTSHGSQVTDGMSGLVGFMNGLGHTTNLYDWNNGGTGGALDLRDYALNISGASDLGNPDWTTWEQATRDYLGAPDAGGHGSSRPEINVIMWSWCGQVGWASVDNINTYLSLMSGLEASYPAVNFVYMTGHLDGSGAAGNLNVRNQQIRDYCIANNKVLYDFADIESYDPDGAVNYMQLLANDNCDYDSNGDGTLDTNWALNWQGAHTQDVDWYACSAAHSQALNGNRKAYAAWWMFARLAGWNATPAPTGPSISTFSPTYGKPGGSVTISGSGFGATGTVKIGGVAAAVTSWTSTRITATVPAGVVFGKVAVATTEGTGTSAGDFLPVASEWYFAEGYTGAGAFQEYLCLGNPGAAGAHARAVYMFTDGTTSEQDALVPADSRTTIDVNATAGQDKSLSALVVADQAIVAERPMYFNYGEGWTGGHDAVGATAPSATWYFAEGYTGPGFDEYICVLNPGGSAADLTFRFQTQEAGPVVKSGYSVGPRTRGTFKVNDVLGPDYQASLKLESSQPVVAERPMYFNYQGAWSGGHCVMGAPDLSNQYFFAEGTTRAGFDEWLTIQNPGEAEVTVNAVYQLGPGQGDNVNRGYKVGAGERATVFVAREVGADKDVSVMLTGTGDFLAERPMYFNYQGAWSGGHCVIGATSPGNQWFFAEGYTGSGFHEWLCLQNPGTSEATVEITYLTQEAGALPARTVKVPAGSRQTVLVNSDAGEGYQLSTRLRVTAGPDVVAERPMYFNYAGAWTGGHDVVGYRP
jgi:hypothetical protein